MVVRHVRKLLLLAAPAAMLACSDIGIAPGSATVRFINAIPGAGQLQFTSNTGFPISGLIFQKYSGCTQLVSGTVTFSFGGQGSGITPTTMTPVTLFGGGKYTVMATGNAARPTYLVLPDTFTAPASGSAMLRVVNDIPSDTSVDVYVGAPNAPLVTPRQTNIAFGSAAYIPVQAGTPLEVWLTTSSTSGTPTILANTAPADPLNFTEGEEVSLFFIPPSGGSTPLYFTVPGC